MDLLAQREIRAEDISNRSSSISRHHIADLVVEVPLVVVEVVLEAAEEAAKADLAVSLFLRHLLC